jgi:DNA ligase-4
VEGKEFLIETKFDGERIQVHFTPEQMRYFTRNANDYTHIYGQKMTDIIRQCVNAHSAILDGEIVVVDRVSGQ